MPKIVPDEIKFTALHEHYNNTFEIISNNLKQRGLLTAMILITMGFITLYAFWPSNAVDAFTQLTASKLGFSVTVGANYLGSILWLALLIVVVRYTQVTVHIERMYAYLHKIEDELQEYYTSETIFTREGKSYLGKYPMYSNWICFLYTVILPVLLLTAVLAKIVSEWAITGLNVITILNSIVAISILITVVLYMVFMSKQK